MFDLSLARRRWFLLNIGRDDYRRHDVRFFLGFGFADRPEGMSCWRHGICLSWNWLPTLMWRFEFDDDPFVVFVDSRSWTGLYRTRRLFGWYWPSQASVF